MDASRRVRGQASAEMIVTLGIILMVLMLIGYVIFQRWVRTTDLKIYITGQRIANSIADNVNTVRSIGDGFSMETTLPFRMYSTQGYEVVFYNEEPTVFVHGGSFARSRTLYYSAPISTSVVGCNLHECNNLCNTTETSICLQVNRSLDIKVKSHMDGVYLTPEYNLVQGILGQPTIVSEIRPFSGSNVSADYVKIAANVSGTSETSRRSIAYLYRDETDKSLYLVFHHRDMDGNVRMNFSDMMGNMTVVYSDLDGNLNLSASPQGDWTMAGAVERGGILKVNTAYMRICINPEQMSPSATRYWYWVNRDYKLITLDKMHDRILCLSYP